MSLLISEVGVFIDSANIIYYNAIWDTGASESMITNRVVSDLSLKKSGKVTISNVYDQKSDVDRFSCNFFVCDGYGFSVNPGIFPQRHGCDVIIGMDIISLGLFQSNRGVLSFIYK